MTATDLNEKNERIAAGFTGPSGAGKTTLILKICARLIADGKKVVAVKTDSNEKAVIHSEEKDSARYFKAGADVILASPSSSILFSHGGADLEELVKLAGDFDFLLIEGLRRISLPRICIFRDIFEPDYLKYAAAVATGPDIDRNIINSNLKIFDLEDIDSIIQWIYKNGIRCP